MFDIIFITFLIVKLSIFYDYLINFFKSYSKIPKNVHALLAPVVENFNNASLEHEEELGNTALVDNGEQIPEFNEFVPEQLPLIEETTKNELEKDQSLVWTHKDFYQIII